MVCQEQQNEVSSLPQPPLGCCSIELLGMVALNQEWLSQAEGCPWPHLEDAEDLCRLSTCWTREAQDLLKEGEVKTSFNPRLLSPFSGKRMNTWVLTAFPKDLRMFGKSVYSCLPLPSDPPPRKSQETTSKKTLLRPAKTTVVPRKNKIFTYASSMLGWKILFMNPARQANRGVC